MYFLYYVHVYLHCYILLHLVAGFSVIAKAVANYLKYVSAVISETHTELISVNPAEVNHIAIIQTTDLSHGTMRSSRRYYTIKYKEYST